MQGRDCAREKLPAPELLRHPRLRVIFLARNPAPALESLLDLSKKYYNDRWTPEMAVDYYVERVTMLNTLRNQLSGMQTAAVLTYDELTEQPEVSMNSLTTLLNLNPPLTSSYAPIEGSGFRGDPGEKIQLGVIQRSDRELTGRISGDLLDRANAAYKAYRELS